MLQFVSPTSSYQHGFPLQPVSAAQVLPAAMYQPQVSLGGSVRHLLPQVAPQCMATQIAPQLLGSQEPTRRLPSQIGLQQLVPQGSQEPTRHLPSQMGLPQLVSQGATQTMAPKDDTQYNAQPNGNVDSWLSLEGQAARRNAFGLDKEPMLTFLNEAEYISLGTYCGVARSLQALGIKGYAYPFDWTRSPVEGLLHLFDNNFADFLTYSTTSAKNKGGTVYGSSQWGGSFWHHDPEKTQAKEEFTRRIERLLGMRQSEVKASKPRVFIRAVNSTRELGATLKLFQKLKSALPLAKVYLLVLIDLQSNPGPVCISGSEGQNLIFYRIDEKLFGNNGLDWTEQKASDAYAMAIGFAVNVWTGNMSAKLSMKEMANLEALEADCDQFDGGNPASDLFIPMRFKGQTMTIRKEMQVCEGQMELKSSSLADQMRVQIASRSPMLEATYHDQVSTGASVSVSSQGTATPNPSPIGMQSAGNGSAPRVFVFPAHPAKLVS